MITPHIINSQFSQVCALNSLNGWTVVHDQWKGSYAYKDKEWIAFDDKELVRNKAFFVREHNLLGAALNALIFDDLDNQCGHGKFPMLNEMHSILKHPRKNVAISPMTKLSTTDATTQQSSTIEPITEPSHTTTSGTDGFIDVIKAYLIRFILDLMRFFDIFIEFIFAFIGIFSNFDWFYR